MQKQPPMHDTDPRLMVISRRIEALLMQGDRQQLRREHARLRQHMIDLHQRCYWKDRAAELRYVNNLLMQGDRKLAD